MKNIERAGLSGVLLWVLLLPQPGFAAPEGKKPAEDVPPPVVSPWQSWDFDGSIDRVRSEFLLLVKEEGLTATVREERTGHFVTDLVEFNDKKFGVDVAIPPPKAGPKYPYFQLNDMTSGRFGLEARLGRLSDSRTHVDLRALLEIRGMDEKIRGMRWVPRISNGEVERYFFTRLSLRLLKPPATNSSR